jgi:hypothetical protein
MEHHGIKMIGDFETDNVKSKNGVDAIEIDDSTGQTRIVYGSPAAGYSLRSADANGNLVFGTPSIPSNAIVLFESDTAINGYTLLTTVNDQVVYITRGSAAGGETGGTTKSGSTWSQPTHTHSVGSHTHSVGSHTHTTGNHTLTISEMPSHTHNAMDGSGGDETNSITVDGGNFSGQNAQSGWRSSATYDLISYTGGGNSHNHGSTGSASGTTGSSTGNTGSSGTVNTWRPSGRNYTRQQRN